MALKTGSKVQLNINLAWVGIDVAASPLKKVLCPTGLTIANEFKAKGD
jgi:hypothetical protein